MAFPPVANCIFRWVWIIDLSYFFIYIWFNCLPSYLSARPPVYFYVRLPICLSVHLYTYLPACLSKYLSTNLPVHQFLSIPVKSCLHVFLSTFLPDCLFTCLIAYQPAFLSTFLFLFFYLLLVYLYACLFVYESIMIICKHRIWLIKINVSIFFSESTKPMKLLSQK